MSNWVSRICFSLIVRRGNGRLSETTVTLVRLVLKFDLKHLNCSVVLSFINSLNAKVGMI